MVNLFQNSLKPSESYLNAQERSAGLEGLGNLFEGASIISNVFSGIMEANNYKFRSRQAQIEALSIKNTAEEQVEALRENLLKDLSEASAAFSSRGVASSSGTVQSLIQESAANVGEDVKKVNLMKEREMSKKNYESQMYNIGKDLTRIKTGQRAAFDITKLVVGAL